MHMARQVQPLVWTLDELDRLPDDGNKYELVRGELFVTPAPSPRHERIVVVLSDILGDYVRAHGIGRAFRARAVVRVKGNEVEPDIMVRQWTAHAQEKWEHVPLPLLVVEVLSGVTRRRDSSSKREFYLDLGIPDYWIVDGTARTIRSIRPGTEDVVASDVLSWHPLKAAEPLALDIPAMFREALGD
jgi:Uma2 family endonuclease